MGLVATVIEFLRETVEGAFVPVVKVDPGGEDTLTIEHWNPPGVDAVPLADDFVGMAPGAGTGRWLVLGYIDPANEGTATEGEYRAYSRNPDDGAIRVTIRLAADEDFVHLGDDVAAALVARADRVESELAAIKMAFSTHTHSTNAGTDGAAATIDPSTDFGYEPGDVGCDKVKGT